MRFTIVSLFPEFFETPLRAGLMGKAVDAGLVGFDFVNPRDFTEDAHRTVDDRPYGGGPGMVMMPEPTARALRSIERPGRMLLLSPKGRPLTQELARELAAEEDVTLVCGRYEGIDARLEEIFPLEPVSVGDFVLNGGEAGALCVIEAASRLVPGFMGHEDSGEEESFSAGLLEYPHYTRPEIFEERAVPEILLSGDHGRVAAWRREQALQTTLRHRPELLAEAALTDEDVHHLKRVGRSAGRARLGKNLYLALVHYPVLNKHDKPMAVSLTNLDIHDIARVARTNGLGGYYVCTPLDDQRALIEELVAHWVCGPGREANPDRSEALSLVRVKRYLEEAIEDVQARTGAPPKVVATSARMAGSLTSKKVQKWLAKAPVLMLLGTASGLARQVLDQADGVLRPVRYLDEYNHLSVRTATAVLVDRLLGDVL